MDDDYTNMKVTHNKVKDDASWGTYDIKPKDGFWKGTAKALTFAVIGIGIPAAVFYGGNYVKQGLHCNQEQHEKIIDQYKNEIKALDAKVKQYESKSLEHKLKN